MRREKQKNRIVSVLFLKAVFCEQPPLDMLRSVGRTCYVVDDDLLIGLRWILHDIVPDGDPLRALAEAYIEDSSYSPVQHDLRKPKEKIVVETN